MSFIDNIKSVPITDFAERIGFTTVRRGHKYVSLKEHDSVMIDTYKNCFWRNSTFSRGMKGGAGSVIDFAIEFNGASDSKEAIRQIASLYGIEGDKTPLSSPSRIPAPRPAPSLPEKPVTSIDFPKKAESNLDVFNYLHDERAIDRSVLRYFFSKKLLYEDDHKNCVFATPLFCCVRSTGEKRFVQDKPGCDYQECFHIKTRKGNDTLVVAESVIDIMSVMTDICHKDQRFVNYDYLALSGVSKMMSVKYHTDKNPDYKTVVLCYDNDDAGRNAIEATKESLSGTGINVVVRQAPSGKDWNEYIKTSGVSSR